MNARACSELPIYLDEELQEPIAARSVVQLAKA